MVDQRAHLQSHFRVLADIRRHPRLSEEQAARVSSIRADSLSIRRAKDLVKQYSHEGARSQRNVHYWMPLSSNTNLLSKTTADHQQFTPSSTPSEQLDLHNTCKIDPQTGPTQPLALNDIAARLPNDCKMAPVYIFDPRCTWSRVEKSTGTDAARLRTPELVLDTRPYLTGSFRHALREAASSGFMHDDIICDRIQEMSGAVDRMDHASFCVSSWHLRERLLHLKDPRDDDW